MDITLDKFAIYYTCIPVLCIVLLGYYIYTKNNTKKNNTIHFKDTFV